MRASQQEQQALIGLLTKLYHEIRSVEAEWNILGREGDMRSRIEYYHDAIRALTSGSADIYAKGQRLSVEYLAYDVQMLRHIEANPLVGTRAATGQQMSPGTALVVKGKASPDARPGRDVRNRLAELYKGYTVFFVALLCETADRNHQSRTEDLNNEVTDLAAVDRLMVEYMNGKPVERDLLSMLDQVTDDKIREQINAMIHAKKKQELDKGRGSLRAGIKARDQEIAAIEKAHFTYVTSQLSVYENAKDTVKKLAGQGMNLAGNFVQGAMSEALGGRTTRGR